MYPIDAFYRSVLNNRDAIAVEDGDHTLTYQALHDEVQALAVVLQDIDPDPGSRVAICAGNHLEHVVSWLAVLAAGKAWVPLFPGHGTDELLRIIDFVDATIVLTDPEHLHRLNAATARVVPMDNSASGTQGLRRRHAGAQPVRHTPDLSETTAIKFTGGTTGVPKGVMQTHRGWNTNLITTIRAYAMDHTERYLAAAPITHGTSTYLLPTLAVGGTVVLTNRPKPAEMLSLLREKRITTVFVAPTMIVMLLDVLNGSAAHTDSLRNLVYGAAPMQPDMIEQAQRAFGSVLASTYGQTEAPQIATWIGPDDLARPELRASVGRSTLLTRVEVMQADGQLCPPGQEGEVVIRGDLVMKGYWKQPKKTAETLIDGWLHTGDVGVIDAQGYLFLKGRLRDVVISGGFNVYPADVEAVLVEFPDVIDAAIYGIPDAKWGEAVHAAVVMRAGASLDVEALQAFVKERIGSVKTPKQIVVRDSLPRNAYGKLQKQILINDDPGTQELGR